MTTRSVALDGVRLDALDEQETITHVLSELGQGRGGMVLTINTDIMRQLNQPVGRTIAHRAELSVADGMPLVLASRLVGDPLPGRVTGSSLIWTLSKALLDSGGVVALIGGREGASARAAVKLEQIRGRGRVIHDCPPMGFEHDDDELERLRTWLKAERPDVVFMGLGFPKQEIVAEALRDALPTAWFVGCGGSIDLMAGDLRRAPHWMQWIGLEWIFRLAQEPRRLGPRYLVHGVPFTSGLLWRSVQTRLGRNRPDRGEAASCAPGGDPSSARASDVA
jgi:N-acetylglucosaminyldiphosphoundecaprenol N-acetyl-beta-D-mannosaminyltransferase